MRRVVVDCNVLVSALLSANGAPAQLLDRWADGEFELIVSPLLLAELKRVLARPKLRRLVDDLHVRALLTGLAEDAVLIDDPPTRVGLTPDPGDDYLMTLAQEAGAHYVVSGDTHLTGLVDPQPRVLSPREYLQAR